jgi:5-formyltetrahydrofolate cyclo-ligase
MSSIVARKRRLRTEARKRRDEAAAKGDIGARLIDLFEQHISLPRDITISGYYPVGSEANILPLLNALQQKGLDLSLPVVDKSHSPLIFRRWDEATEMQEGAFGILEPTPDAGSVYPGLMLIPLLAFDRQGNRLGYGGGFYDLSIRSIREQQPVYALGVAFAAQEVTAVPCDENDTTLDGILTEKGVIRVESEIT